MKYIYGPYFILLIHLINLTLRLHLKHIVDRLSSYTIQTDLINSTLNNLFKSNKIFDNGTIDMTSVINIILFFVIGYNFSDNLTATFISIILIEGCLVYYDDDARMIINLIMAIISYLIGLYFNSHFKYRRRILQYNKDTTTSHHRSVWDPALENDLLDIPLSHAY